MVLNLELKNLEANKSKKVQKRSRYAKQKIITLLSRLEIDKKIGIIWCINKYV